MRIPLLLSCLFIFVGCKSLEELKANDNMTAKEIIESNAFIEEDPAPPTRSTKTFWTSTRRAACYRFYKALSYDEKGIGTCVVKSGAELNMSEELFQTLLRDQLTTKEHLLNEISKGKEIVMPDMEKYLNSLLNE